MARGLTLQQVDEHVQEQVATVIQRLTRSSKQASVVFATSGDTLARRTRLRAQVVQIRDDFRRALP